LKVTGRSDGDRSSKIPKLKGQRNKGGVGEFARKKKKEVLH